MRTSVMRVMAVGVLALLMPALPAAAQSVSALQVLAGHAPEPVAVGSDVSFDFVVTNDGPGDATAVQVVMTFRDADAVLASFQAAQGQCSETAPGEVSCDLGTLAQGATVATQIVLTPITASTLGASAQADSAEGAVGSASDSATVTGPSCDVVGTQGDDTLTAASPGDVVCGLGGDDGITGVDGDETLLGGTGDDALAGGLGNDVLDGGNGTDLVTFAASALAVQADLAAGTALTGAETDGLADVEDITGSAFDDWIAGSSGPNRIAGGDGLDLLWGRDDADTLLGEGGDDYLNGGAGADSLDGGAGVNTCAVGDTPVACHADSPLDQNDAQGVLDLRRIRTVFGAARSSWFFNALQRWSLKGIWDEGYALVFLDTSGDAAAEYRIVVRVRTDGRGVTATLRRLRDGRQWVLDAWRSGSKSVAVGLPMNRVSFGAGRLHFRWWGETLLSRGGCLKAVCIDVVAGSEGTLETLIQPVP